MQLCLAVREAWRPPQSPPQQGRCCCCSATSRSARSGLCPKLSTMPLLVVCPKPRHSRVYAMTPHATSPNAHALHAPDSASVPVAGVGPPLFPVVVGALPHQAMEESRPAMAVPFQSKGCAPQHASLPALSVQPHPGATAATLCSGYRGRLNPKCAAARAMPTALQPVLPLQHALPTPSSLDARPRRSSQGSWQEAPQRWPRHSYSSLHIGYDIRIDICICTDITTCICILTYIYHAHHILSHPNLYTVPKTAPIVINPVTPKPAVCCINNSP